MLINLVLEIKPFSHKNLNEMLGRLPFRFFIEFIKNQIMKLSHHSSFEEPDKPAFATALKKFMLDCIRPQGRNIR